MARLFAAALCLATTACGPGLGAKFARPTDTTAYEQKPRYSVRTGEIAVTNSWGNVAVGFDQAGPLKGSTSHHGTPYVVSTKPCQMFYFGSDHAGDFYMCSKNISVVVKDRERMYGGGVYVPYKVGEGQYVWWAGPALLGTESAKPVPVVGLLYGHGGLEVYVAPSDPPVTKISKRFLVAPDIYVGRGFTSTLTYLGMASGKILFSYREFIDGQARPAFSQNVELDYRPGQTYTYKSGQFIVHQASVEELDMTLLHPM